jgi:hypothetical protein
MRSIVKVFDDVPFRGYRRASLPVVPKLFSDPAGTEACRYKRRCRVAYSFVSFNSFARQTVLLQQ